MHLSADGAGNGLGGALTPGPAGDCPEVEGLLRPWLAPAQEVVADAADDRDALRELIARAGANAVIPPHPGRQAPPHVDPVAYQKRHPVEQTFRKLKQHRRVAIRYDNLDRSSEAFLCLRITTWYLN